MVQGSIGRGKAVLMKKFALQKEPVVWMLKKIAEWAVKSIGSDHPFQHREVSGLSWQIPDLPARTHPILAQWQKSAISCYPRSGLQRPETSNTGLLSPPSPCWPARPCENDPGRTGGRSGEKKRFIFLWEPLHRVGILRQGVSQSTAMFSGRNDYPLTWWNVLYV